MRLVATATLLAALLAVPAPSPAQEMAGPPKVLLFEWETLRPGTGAAHDRVAAGFAALAAKMKSPGHWIGLNAVSGDENQALFLGGFPSFAAVQQWREADEAAVAGSAAVAKEMERLEKAGAATHAAVKAVYTTYQSEISYHPPGPAEVGKARFMEITVVRVRPGRNPEYIDFMKAMNQAREKANVPWRMGAFQVVSGAASNTFILVRPMSGLAELDGEYGKAVMAALGDEQWKKLRGVYAEVVEESTRTIFAISPKISYPYPSIADADPAFWKPAAKGGKGK
jgi:hypothetical protein